MPLYDYRCRNGCCVVEDVYGKSAKDYKEPCAMCGGEMVWRPFVRTQSTRADFDCEYSGRRHHSYNDLEKWAKRHNKTVLPAKEFEQLRRETPEERFAKPRPKLRKELEKNLYKLRHGHETRVR